MRALLATILIATLAAPAAAQAPADPAALLRAWAEAYATNDGPRAAAFYTEDARLWGSVSREQTVGRAAIAQYFGRVRPGAAQIAVRFGDHGLRMLGPEVAVAPGHYTFRRRTAEGAQSEEPSRFSMTLLRGADGAWRIADHHSSRLPRQMSLLWRLSFRG